MESYQPSPKPISKRVVAYVASAVVAAGTLGGYAVHEHRVAQNLATQNEQTDAALNATRNQVDDLTTKVNTLAAQAQQAQSQRVARAKATSHVAATSRRTDSAKLKKMQAQLDAQNKAIEDTRTDLTTTQGDLSSTKTELTGSIARTHDELVLLQKRGERNYYEFDLDRSKQFSHNGPFGVRRFGAAGR